MSIDNFIALTYNYLNYLMQEKTLNIILASENKSKLIAVKKFYPQNTVVGVWANPEVSSRPVNEETILGAYNRVNNINLINDLVIGIEGGYFNYKNNYYLADICCIKDKNGFKFGSGPFFLISKNMFDCVQQGYSLNKLINTYVYNRSFTNFFGLIGYLSRKKFKRDMACYLSIHSAVNSEYTTLKAFKPDYSNIIDLRGIEFYKLDEICESVLKTHKLELDK